MNERRNKRISKFLSLILRHQPELIGLKLDVNGWANVNELIEKSASKGNEFSFDELQVVVRTNNKKRFSFNGDCTKIKANQGHSIKVALDLEAKKPPVVLYHGTAKKNLDSILSKGLVKGARHHVHLSADVDTALKVGQRHGKPIILEVDTVSMIQNDIEFYCSENGVWLTDFVHPTYLKFTQND